MWAFIVGLFIILCRLFINWSLVIGISYLLTLIALELFPGVPISKLETMLVALITVSWLETKFSLWSLDMSIPKLKVILDGEEVDFNAIEVEDV